MNKQYFDEIRMKRHVSLEKLAELTCIPLSTLTKISAGKIQTSFENMCRIAQALECSLDDFADHPPFHSSIPCNPSNLLTQFHTLSSQNQHAIHMIFEMEQNNAFLASDKNRKILCYIPILWEERCFFQDCLTTATLSLPNHYQYEKVDFAWQITNLDYEPYFFPSDILLLKCQAPSSNEIALFQQNNHLFFQRYIREHHTDYLYEILPKQCPPQIWTKEKCRCLGTLHSIIRANSPLYERIHLTIS